MTRILAYSDRVSLAPTESVKIMVSCDGLESYDAQLVRVIQGDINPDGPGYREKPLPLHLGGPFKARYQSIHAGSHAEIADAPVLHALSSFTLQTYIWPTTPAKGTQTIMCREDPTTGAGFRLFLDEAGALAFCVSISFEQCYMVSSGLSLLAAKWYLISASYNADSGMLCISQQPIFKYAGVNDQGSMSTAAAPDIGSTSTASIVIAARPAADERMQEHFNGRIEAPRIYSTAISLEEMNSLHSASRPDTVAAWDFSIDIPSDRITDISSNNLHGRLINLPARGIPGQGWNGDEHCWSNCPANYASIHFHDDDLYDCKWEADFEIRVPEDLPSGVYAVRLYAGDESYYVPFAVRAPLGKTTAPIVFLMPTASYMAYANNRIGIDVPETEIVAGRLLQLNPIDLYMQEHPEIGLSFYDLHNDGSGVFYSSRLRPIVNMQPGHIGHLGGSGSNVWQFNADTHILDWLEQLGQPFDVITDEDLEVEGVAAISGYRAIITGSHPEYYSLRMLDSLQEFTNSGGRLMYMGGNGFYWRVSYHPALSGVIECRKSEDGIRASAPGPGEFYSSFTGEYTGLWRRNGRPPNELVGVGMVSQGFDRSSPYVRTADSHDPRAAFIFEGVNNETFGDFGLSGGGAAGLELDAADPLLGTPPNALVLASSKRHTDLYLMTPEDMNDPAPGLGGTEAEIIRADMVFFETSGHGAVFSTGSIAWAGSLSHDGYDNDVAQITTNVLKRFLDETPF